MKYFFVFNLSLFLFVGYAQESRTYLDDWFLDLGENDFQTTIPSEVHMDLYMAGVTTHPYSWQDGYFENMIENEQFVYQTSFSGKELINREHIDLVFEGLDTYAEVVLNDSVILNANNMFRSWEIDVSTLIIAENNILKIIFTNPVQFHKGKNENANYQLPSGNETVENKVANQTRKACYQFGWDWAERFVGCGIWRPVYIRTWDHARISDFYVETIEASDEEAEIAYHLAIENGESKKKKSLLVIDDREYKIVLERGSNNFEFHHKIKQPKLWYPNGYGEPSMHVAKAEIQQQGKVLDKATVHYGIRTIELVQGADSIGTSFYFKVNSQPIFAKGANYVPQSSFPSEVDPLAYKKIISEAREANMNMLRVWGGGIYEADLFYKFCDENGILIWQDFMFANSLFPNDSAFKENVQAEVYQNVKRIRRHPCLALWCGNNEIEVAWNNWGWQDTYGWSAEDSIEIWNNYSHLFHEVIPTIVAEESPSVPYVSTSPLSNWGKAENFNHSSMHYWGVWHGEDDFSDFKKNVGRFMVEYGFQSYPNYNQLLKYSNGTIDFESEFLKNRQKSYVGDKLISKEINKRYGEVNDIKTWLELSQFIQAIALKEAITSHRLSSKCMGTLFWQFNDCWPGPSWSVINYDLTKKIGFETVKNLYSPQMVAVDTADQMVAFWAVSDSPEKKEVSLKIKVIQGFNTLLEKSIPTELTFLESKKIAAFPLNEIKTIKSLPPYILFTLKDRKTGETLFEDIFSFGLSAEEQAILLRDKKAKP